MNIGIVGIGYWGSKVVDEYVDLKESRQIHEVAAYDADSSQFATLSGVDQTFTSLENLLSYVDAIHVCTPNHTHIEIATRAIRQEKDVLVEKPLTTDRESAYDLVELASEHGRILQTGHIFRFANVIRKVKELYEDDYFGTVYDMSLRWTHWMEPRSSTNVIWDLLPHPIDISNFITGEWPNNPVGTTSGPRTGVVESAKVQTELDGANLFVEVSWNDRIRRRSLEISGSKRSARVDCVDQEIEVFSDDQQSELEPIQSNNTIRDEAENFIQSIETGKNTFNSAIVGARTVDKISQIETAITNDRR